MSNNSAVTLEGGEIGRAQACQAEACRVPIVNDLNPLLLKPSGDRESQVVLHGKVNGVVSSDFGLKRVNEFKTAISESYDRLASKYDVILIEGAGSCAELNLLHRDLANLWIAKYTDARALLISDIERGGIFASLLGTLDLLDHKQRERVIGLVVNKFRGARDIFDEGRKVLEDRSGKPVLGVLPYVRNHHMPDEDNASFETRSFHSTRARGAEIRVGVIVPPHVSNITDIEPLLADNRFHVQALYAAPMKTESDIIIIPGSKNVIEDLIELKRRGFRSFLEEHCRQDTLTIGICGGYQMLGRFLTDPHGIETRRIGADGFGLLDVTTELYPLKTTLNVKGVFIHDMSKIAGYEIHCGKTSGKDTTRPLVQVFMEKPERCNRTDGAMSENGRVWGTYIHGLFDNHTVRDYLCKQSGVNAAQADCPADPYERIASAIASNLNLDPILCAIQPNKGARNVE